MKLSHILNLCLQSFRHIHRITALLDRAHHLVDALAQGHAAEGLQIANASPENISQRLTGIWGKFNIFHTQSSATGILCNVLLAAYHIGCLFEAIMLLIDYYVISNLSIRGMGIL